MIKNITIRCDKIQYRSKRRNMERGKAGWVKFRRGEGMGELSGKSGLYREQNSEVK